ncbi:MAG TPA: hypothetical protein ENN84_11715 [Candidatus Marinimicrobia bacterium]|nr:hypothetical protein [Candidatus Neomarinimicrobiota bacterium]
MNERDDSLLGQKVSMDQKIRLYQLMEQIKNLRPWEKLYEDQLFAIKIPSRYENAFISVLGNSGLDYSICAFLGKEGLEGFYGMQDTLPMTIDHLPNPYFDFVGLTCPRVQATFIPYSQMEKEDLALIRKLKLNFSKGIGYPVFLSFVPGFYPAPANCEEADILIDAIEQLIELFPSLTAPDADKNFYFCDDEKFLLRVPQVKNGKKVWKDDLYIDNMLPKVNELSYSYSEIQLHQYRKTKGKTIGDLEYVFFLAPLIIEATERAHWIFLSAFIDSDSGHIVSYENLAPLPNYDAMLKKMPSVIMNQLMALDGMPEKVWVDHDLAKAFLSPLESIGIEIYQVEELEWLLDIYENMLDFIEKDKDTGPE